MKILSLISLLTLFCAFPAFADPDNVTPASNVETQNASSRQASDSASVEFNKAYLKSYATDLGSILTSPMRWDSTDWLTAGIVTGVAVGLYDNDAKLQKWVLDHKTSTTSDVGDKVTLVGFGALSIPVVGGMYLYGHLADDSKMRKTALLTVESFVLTGVIVQTLKFSSHRHRPYADDGSRAFDGPSLKSKSETASFPSGHASSAFAMATVIASEYDSLPAQTLCYGVASITALNRVAHNAHWSSDIFVGSAIGYFTGKAVVASHQGAGNSRVSIAPAIIDDRTGLVLTYQF